jgi:hypothetical protein
MGYTEMNHIRQEWLLFITAMPFPTPFDDEPIGFV